MKKKSLIILSIILVTLCFTSCKSCKKEPAVSDFSKLVNIIYDSETKFIEYQEQTYMFDNDFEVYNKQTDFKITRGDVVETVVYTTEKKLSSSGTSTYDETITSYKTIGTTKYVTIGDNVYEYAYVIPTYYLTFVLSEDYLNNDYTLTVNENNYNLKAKVLSNKASALFLNKNIGSISNLEIEIKVENNQLVMFKASYLSQNGFNVVIETNYNY